MTQTDTDAPDWRIWYSRSARKCGPVQWGYDGKRIDNCTWPRCDCRRLGPMTKFAAQISREPKV